MQNDTELLDGEFLDLMRVRTKVYNYHNLDTWKD